MNSHNMTLESPPEPSEASARDWRRTILYVDHTAKMGGGEIALYNLVCALDLLRYRPIVALAAEGPFADRLRTAGIEVHVLPLDTRVLETRKDGLGVKSLLRLGQGWACVCYAVRLARLAKELQVDLIHTNSLKSDLYGGLAGRIAGIPVLWHVRDSIDDKYLPRVVAVAFRALSRLLPHAVVANSESTLRTLRPPQRQVSAAVKTAILPQVVHDGYDTGAFPTIAKLDPNSTPPQPTDWRVPVVSLVGRIARWKGQHIFIEAAALVCPRFPDVRFQVIGAPLFGEHDYEAEIRQQVVALDLTKEVVFLGFRDDVPALLAETDILVHASTLGEPFGQVVIEGMAAGKPVIATNGGALPEIVLPGETGLLVPMGDAPALAGAILQLLADPAAAQVMGAAGRRRVQERFTIRHTLASLETVYDRLLGKPFPNSASPNVL